MMRAALDHPVVATRLSWVLVGVVTLVGACSGSKGSVQGTDGGNTADGGNVDGAKNDGGPGGDRAASDGAGSKDDAVSGSDAMPDGDAADAPGDVPADTAGDALADTGASDSLPIDAKSGDATDAGDANDAGGDADSGLCAYVVDVAHGLDSNAGSVAAPWKTITKAMSVAMSGCSVSVLGGTYTNGAPGAGETFPLSIPAGVSLIGDEANKGNGAQPVTITGTLTGNSQPVIGLLQPGAGSTIAGFTLALTSVGAFRATVMLTTTGVTLRNNTLTGSKSNTVLYVDDPGGGHTIVHNVMTGNTGVCLFFGGSGPISRVEGNVIRLNGYIGVEMDAPNADFGGGALGSAGGNVISCNTYEDFADYAPSSAIAARSNQWDHAPPTHSGTGGAGIDVLDVADGSGKNLDTTGATVAASPCP